MIKLTEEARRQLRVLQKAHRGSVLYIRITVLLMLDMEMSVSEIAVILGIDQTTVNRYLVLYQSVKLSEYLTLNYVGYEGKLSEEELGILDKELQEYLYINTHEVIDFVEKEFGEVYEPSGMSKLLKRLGFSYKKTQHEPLPNQSEAHIEAQKAFLVKMEGILAEVKANPAASTAYFVDGVHPQHNTKSDYGWIKTGQEFAISTNSGRRRVNLNGAINAHDVTDVAIDEAERINQTSMQRLIVKLVEKNPNKRLYLFHDNARYYYAQDLKKWIADTYPLVTQVFLPPYSPNLNLIERLWKFMKKQIINYQFYDSFNDFRRAILDFFENIKHHKKQLESLLTLNFHVA